MPPPACEDSLQVCSAVVGSRPKRLLRYAALLACTGRERGCFIPHVPTVLSLFAARSGRYRRNRRLARQAGPADGGEMLGKIQHIVVLDAREPLVRPHARVLVRRTAKRLPRRATLRRPDRRPNPIPMPNGKAVRCSRSRSATPNAYFMPGADPGEGYAGDQRPALRQPDGAGASRGDQCTAS